MAISFVMVAKDRPIFDVDFTSDEPHFAQFVLHSSLDLVEEFQWQTGNLFLGVIDKFNSMHVSAYLTTGGIKMLLIHQSLPVETVKAFFNDVAKLYVKTLLNPLYIPYTPIKTKAFRSSVVATAKKFLGASV